MVSATGHTAGWFVPLTTKVTKLTYHELQGAGSSLNESLSEGVIVALLRTF